MANRIDLDMPALHLSVQYASKTDCPPRPQLRRWVQTVLQLAPEAHTHAAVQLTLRFVDTDEGRSLNRDFRHKDYATNVLTFSYDESDLLAADVVICAPVIEREAREQDKPVLHHYAHMVIHGVLHALGHDHEIKAEAVAMEAMETRILKRFRIADPYR